LYDRLEIDIRNAPWDVDVGISSIVPTLSGYYIHPFGRERKFFIKIGGGLGKYSGKVEWKSPYLKTCKGNSIGYHGLVGIGWKERYDSIFEIAILSISANIDEVEYNGAVAKKNDGSNYTLDMSGIEIRCSGKLLNF